MTSPLDVSTDDVTTHLFPWPVCMNSTCGSSPHLRGSCGATDTRYLSSTHVGGPARLFVPRLTFVPLFLCGLCHSGCNEVILSTCRCAKGVTCVFVPLCCLCDVHTSLMSSLTPIFFYSLPHSSRNTFGHCFFPYTKSVIGHGLTFPLLLYFPLCENFKSLDRRWGRVTEDDRSGNWE